MSVMHRLNQATMAWLTLLLLLALPLPYAHGQVAGGAIVGTVHDPSSALVLGAKVIARDQATGVVHQTETNADGLFTLPNLPPASYNVSISAPGFADSEANGVDSDRRSECNG